TADADKISAAERHALEAESRSAGARDDELAAELGREWLGRATASAGYLRGLGERPRLPLETERRLVHAAKEGDVRAREELVEAFVPLLAGGERAYRGSPALSRVERLQVGVGGLRRALEREAA